MHKAISLFPFCAFAPFVEEKYMPVKIQVFSDYV